MFLSPLLLLKETSNNSLVTKAKYTTPCHDFFSQHGAVKNPGENKVDPGHTPVTPRLGLRKSVYIKIKSIILGPKQP